MSPFQASLNRQLSHLHQVGPKRMPIRPLLIAEAANPEWVSVPLIGWSLSEALARQTDAHLVTHIRNAPAITRAGLVEGRDFTAIDNEYIARILWRISEYIRGGAGKGWTTIAALSSIAYYAFEREVWRQFSHRISAREFDLVHRITPVSPTSQSILPGKLAPLNVPFVMGPLNGGLAWPRNMSHRQHAEREWLSYARKAYKLLPAYSSTRRKSSAIIVGSQHTLEEMPEEVRHKCIYLPENGIDPVRFDKHRTHRATLPIKIAFLGRLVPYKGADILIRAASESVKSGLAELVVIGDGPQKAELVNLVRDSGIEHGVKFLGWIAHSDVQHELRRCDALVLPSIREFGGGVVLEAMGLGVPVVVADYGGPSELVTDDVGVKIPFTDEESLQAGLKQAIEHFVRNPEQLDSLGRRARDRVHRNFTWDYKAGEIVKIYGAVLRGQTELESVLS